MRNLEGGGGFDSFPIRAATEDSRDVEITPEHSRSSWIAKIIDPAKLEVIRQYPAYEGHSKEWIIMEALLAKKVERGAAMDPHSRARLGALIAALRMLIIPNLTPAEQRFMQELAGATTVNWENIQVEVNPELVEDVDWVWNTFELRKSSVDKLRALQRRQIR